MVIHKQIRDYLYKPQPINYKRVKGPEYYFYEWLLQQNVIMRVYWSKDKMTGYIYFKLWGNNDL
jgi:hypothetical protein